MSVNFVTFLILWKIGKHDEAKRYIDINRKLIELLLDEDINGYRSESQLSVILEQSRQTAGRLGTNTAAGNSRTLHESFATGDSNSVKEPFIGAE